MARTKEFEESVVLQKAMDLFWTRGYNATSAQDLVDGLGISRSSLYSSFGDKHQLFISALLHYRKEMSGKLIKMMNESTDIEATVRQVFQNVIDDALANRINKGCLMTNSSVELAPYDPQIAAIVASNAADIENALKQLIIKGQQRGIFKKTIPASSLSRFLYNNIRGLRVLAKSQQSNREVFDDIVATTLSVLK